MSSLNSSNYHSHPNFFPEQVRPPAPTPLQIAAAKASRGREIAQRQDFDEYLDTRAAAHQTHQPQTQPYVVDTPYSPSRPFLASSSSYQPPQPSTSTSEPKPASAQPDIWGEAHKSSTKASKFERGGYYAPSGEYVGWQMTFEPLDRPDVGLVVMPCKVFTPAHFDEGARCKEERCLGGLDRSGYWIEGCGAWVAPGWGFGRAAGNG